MDVRRTVFFRKWSGRGSSSNWLSIVPNVGMLLQRRWTLKIHYQKADVSVLIPLAVPERVKQNMLRFWGLYWWSVIQACDLDRVSASATHKIDSELWVDRALWMLMKNLPLKWRSVLTLLQPLSHSRWTSGFWIPQFHQKRWHCLVVFQATIDRYSPHACLSQTARKKLVWDSWCPFTYFSAELLCGIY
jgi:hypothetical protein